MVNLSASDSEPNPQLHAGFDVLVIGAGAAGLYAALCLPKSLQIGLVTKDELPLSASDWAQGGIAAAIDPEDSPTLHIEDTLKAGAGLCDVGAVAFLAKEAPECIQSLVDLGVGFDRHGSALALTLEAAHSRRRVLHAADTTGRAIVSILSQQVRSRPNIQILSRAFALDLWIDPQTRRCRGASLLYRSQVYWVSARAVVLATGGGGQVFAKTTNPAVSTGDGVAIAWRAGAVLRDLEFFQFHPTALTKPGAPRFLISEAVRGEGAHLVDDRGRRFAFDYHPAGELAPRDVVSRAIFRYLQSTCNNEPDACVWLDFRTIEPDRIRHRFPNIIQVCRQWGIDVFREPVPVSPAAHYWMGGVAANLSCQTSIPGLYAVGETASTGVHGANRLASNSLLECLVFGAKLGELQLPDWEEIGDASTLENESRVVEIDRTARDRLETLREELPRLVWQSAGICRDAENLQGAIAQIEQWQTLLAELPVSEEMLTLQPNRSVNITGSESHDLLQTWGETRNLLDIADLILKSAAFRQESRGGHYRSDFPDTEPNWQVHTLVRGENWWKSEALLDEAER
ncbi:MAG: L-aspartate oxidase [Cyanobacteriota bacterium]|nr:L-aspartate oxidase [Cyanobacteriota bacterium]